MAIKRLHYFDHQFLVEADFTDEQNYHLDMRRRLNRLLHTFGIAEGLVVAKSANKAVTVSPGTAIDRFGREMIVETAVPVDLSNAALFPANSTVFITLAYQEQQTDPTTATGVTGNTRFTEAPIIQAVAIPPGAAPPTDGTVVRLATFTLDSGANVPGNINDVFDGNVRQPALTRGGVTSVDGVSNPGGNIDLNPGAGITITPDQANRRITIAASAAQGPVSIDGVSNAGGNIDLVQAGTIVITPNDAANTITIGENHSTNLNNPHNVTAAQIEALPFADYDLRQRAFASAAFTQADANNATRTLTTSFRPRVIVMFGTLTVNLSGRSYSGGIAGWAFEVGGSVTQQCFGFGVTRTSNTDWFCRGFTGANLFTTDVLDSGAAPPQRESLGVSISAVSATGLTLTFARAVVGAGNVALSNFNITLNLLCLG